MEAIPFRPLGLIKELIDTTGLNITHVYEDLVFIEHNAFILQMGEQGEDLKIIFNTESEQEKRPEIQAELAKRAETYGLKLTNGGTYSLVEGEEDTLDIEFFEE